MFALSFALTFVYVLLWRKRFDVHLSVIFLLIPMVDLAYVFMYSCPDTVGALALLKFIYLGGCYLPWLTAMCVVELCGVHVSRGVRVGAFIAGTVDYLAVLSMGYSPLFYRSLRLERVGTALVQFREYGPLHTLHYVIILLFLAADLLAILYSYRMKTECSRRILLLLFLPIPVTVASYVATHLLKGTGIELVPLSYTLAQFVYLLIARRMMLYDVSEMVIESMVQSGDTGFITADSQGRYLGSNETARTFLPELRLLTVDRPIREAEALGPSVTDWLDRFRRDESATRFSYARLGPEGTEETIYAVTVSHLLNGKKRCGYQIFLQDDTQNQKYIRLLDRYNADLQAEVDAKTERLVVMHDRLVMGMATMVESRDNSTGGHIRRTSQGVRLLTEAISRRGEPALTEDFRRKLIKAAPMHDLGKIAVDDAILRKPGRFTPEEFEKMQRHAAEGARIVHAILQDTDDEDFRRIAENVAHYHHERWDGSGYPEGLRGEAIPLEARIMAVADVYDALVSKRVYKEKFSFEKADRIIREGMGSQFDPALEGSYLDARPALEAYYAAEQAAAEEKGAEP